MRITITINTDNAAFEEDGYELQRIIQRACDDLDGIQGHELPNGWNVRDINGNTVGRVEVTDDVR